MTAPYIGRFAPSPTGPLHEGSLVAALASWLDARARSGNWRVRLEDLDAARNVAGAAESILAQLDRCGLHADGPVDVQSNRTDRYDVALERLFADGRAYRCNCSRRDLRDAIGPAGGARPRHAGQLYPGTCRNGVRGGGAGADRCAIRFRLDPGSGPRAADDPPLPVRWVDRRLGAQCQDVAGEVGDFVLLRRDGIRAYQLAVVVDDAADGVTDIVRGEDLADNTPRQILLQQALGLPRPRYLHAPLVLAPDGEKLSKQNGARPLDLTSPLAALQRAGEVLDLRNDGADAAGWLAAAVGQWRARWPSP